MSYSATINFKTIPEGELFQFFTHIKQMCKEKMDDIAEDNFIYMPSISKRHLLKGSTEYAQEQLDDAWVRNSIFTFRYFYLPEHHLLGMFGVPNAIDKMFDLTVHFQNSCDQDYEYSEWCGVPLFEKIAEKWKNTSDEEVHNTFDYPDEHRQPIDYDYYRRSNAYNEIWSICEKFLYDESAIVYLSLFGFYDIDRMHFCEKCRTAYEEWKNKIAKDTERRVDSFE